jgi:hypothetical protein
MPTAKDQVIARPPIGRHLRVTLRLACTFVNVTALFTSSGSSRHQILASAHSSPQGATLLATRTLRSVQITSGAGSTVTRTVMLSRTAFE